MEKITTKEEVFKTVKAGTRIRTYYKARDDSIYSTEKACLAHEANLDRHAKLMNIVQCEIDGKMWYLCKDQEELDYLIKQLFDKRFKAFTNVKPGAWFTANLIRGDRWEYEVETLENILEEYHILLETLRSCAEKYYVNYNSIVG